MKSVVLAIVLGSVALGSCNKPVTTLATSFEECALAIPSNPAIQARSIRSCQRRFERTVTPSEAAEVLSENGTFWRSPEVPGMGLGPKDSLKVAVSNPFEDKAISEVLVRAEFVRAASQLNRGAGPIGDVMHVVWRAEVSIGPGANEDVYLYFENHVAPGTFADVEVVASKVIPLG